MIYSDEEALEETIVPIGNDKLIQTFLKLWSDMPDLDHISANKRLKSEGMLKLLSD